MYKYFAIIILKNIHKYLNHLNHSIMKNKNLIFALFCASVLTFVNTNLQIVEFPTLWVFLGTFILSIPYKIGKHVYSIFGGYNDQGNIHAFLSFLGKTEENMYCLFAFNFFNSIKAKGKLAQVIAFNLNGVSAKGELEQGIAFNIGGVSAKGELYQFITFNIGEVSTKGELYQFIAFNIGGISTKRKLAQAIVFNVGGISTKGKLEQGITFNIGEVSTKRELYQIIAFNLNGVSTKGKLAQVIAFNLNGVSAKGELYQFIAFNLFGDLCCKKEKITQVIGITISSNIQTDDYKLGKLAFSLPWVV
ncbi:MAG: hypothetical protein ACI9AR_000534 [Flavobacteriaceae bacterium]|jgi:hypothetical protein